MVPLGPPSARPMAQALRLPFESIIYIIIIEYNIVVSKANLLYSGIQDFPQRVMVSGRGTPYRLVM